MSTPFISGKKYQVQARGEFPVEPMVFEDIVGNTLIFNTEPGVTEKGDPIAGDRWLLNYGYFMAAREIP